MKVLPWELSPSKNEWRLTAGNPPKKVAVVLKRTNDSLWVPRVFMHPGEIGPAFPEVTHAAKWAEDRIRHRNEFSTLFPS
jgi:hypothetical protein